MPPVWWNNVPSGEPSKEKNKEQQEDEITKLGTPKISLPGKLPEIPDRAFLSLTVLTIGLLFLLQPSTLLGKQQYRLMEMVYLLKGMGALVLGCFTILFPLCHGVRDPSPDKGSWRTLDINIRGLKWEGQPHFQNQLLGEFKQHRTVYQCNVHYMKSNEWMPRESLVVWFFLWNRELEYLSIRCRSSRRHCVFTRKEKGHPQRAYDTRMETSRGTEKQSSPTHGQNGTNERTPNSVHLWWVHSAGGKQRPGSDKLL